MLSHMLALKNSVFLNGQNGAFPPTGNSKNVKYYHEYFTVILKKFPKVVIEENKIKDNFLVK